MLGLGTESTRNRRRSSRGIDHERCMHSLPIHARAPDAIGVSDDGCVSIENLRTRRDRRGTGVGIEGSSIEQPPLPERMGKSIRHVQLFGLPGGFDCEGPIVRVERRVAEDVGDHLG